MKTEQLAVALTDESDLKYIGDFFKKEMNRRERAGGLMNGKVLLFARERTLHSPHLHS